MEKETHNQIWKAINDIRENHISHIEKDIAEMRANVSWLMRFFWIVATSSIGALITGVINLL